MKNMGNLVGTIGQFQFTVYSHDDMPTGTAVTPANRFYECLSAGVLMFFDHETKPSFDRMGIDISPWIVASQEDIAEKMLNYKQLRQLQNDKLRNRNYLKELEKEFADIYKKL